MNVAPPARAAGFGLGLGALLATALANNTTPGFDSVERSSVLAAAGGLGVFSGVVAAQAYASAPFVERAIIPRSFATGAAASAGVVIGAALVAEAFGGHD